MNEHREEKRKSRIVTTQDKAGMQVSMHAQHKQTCSTSELVPVHWSFVPVRSHFNGCSQKCYHNTILLLTSGSRETSAIFLKSSMETEVNSTRLRRPLSYKDWREERREGGGLTC